ncbi:hypothetical protein MRX96_021507 [Rhipicephalus microplus]
MVASTGGLRKCRHDCSAAATLELLRVVRSSHGNDHVFQSAHCGAPRPQPQYNAPVVTLAGDATKVEVISVATPQCRQPERHRTQWTRERTHLRYRSTQRDARATGLLQPLPWRRRCAFTQQPIKKQIKKGAALPQQHCLQPRIALRNDLSIPSTSHRTGSLGFHMIVQGNSELKAALFHVLLLISLMEVLLFMRLGFSFGISLHENCPYPHNFS